MADLTLLPLIAAWGCLLSGSHEMQQLEGLSPARALLPRYLGLTSHPNLKQCHTAPLSHRAWQITCAWVQPGLSACPGSSIMPPVG